MNQNNDLNNRKLITSTGLNKNLFVEAGAGSGKTTSLVLRMVNLIKNGIDINGINVPVKTSELCTITFTKVAAGEFKDRFQKRLYEELKDESKLTNKQIENIKNAINDIDLAFMGTIDSFCKKVLDEDPLSANIPSSSTIIDDHIFNNDIENFYDNFINNYPNDLKEFNFFNSLFKNPKDSFVKIVKFINQKSDSKIVGIKELPNSLIDYFGDDFKLLLEFTNSIEINPELLYAKNKCDENEYIEYLKFVKSFKEYSERGTLDFKDHLKKKVKIFHFKTQYINEKYRPIFKDFMKGDKYWTLEYKKYLNEIDEFIYNHSLNFILKYNKDILSSEREKGNLRFIDNLVYLRDMLKEDANSKNHLIIRRLQNKYKYFFLDEFQDTDPIQIQLFFYLSSEIIKPNWYDCIPFDGRLFIVGDPKQSIYKFKGADLNSYNKIKSIFKDLEKINKGQVVELFSNFRSNNKLIHYFNYTFDKLFNYEGSVCTYPIIPDNKNNIELNEDIVEGLYNFDVNDYKNPFEDLPNLIKDIKNNKKIVERYILNGELVEKNRGIKYSDFLIIVPVRTRINEIVDGLYNSGILSNIRGDIDFIKSDLVTNITDCINYLIINDNQSLILLCMNLFDFKEKEISDYFLNKNQKMYQEIGEFIDSIKLIYNSYYNNPSELFRLLMRNKTLLKYSKLNYLNTTYFVLSQIINLENSGFITNVYDLSNYLNDLINKVSDFDYKQNVSLFRIEDKVQIANIHQIKGAEAPIVILCLGNSPTKQVDDLVDFENGSRYIFNIRNTDALNQNYIQTKQFITELDKSFKETKEEEIRLAYVAATRAKNALFICNDNKGEDNRYSYLKNDYKENNYYSYKQYPNIKNPTIIDLDKLKENLISVSKENLDSTFNIINPSKVVEFEDKKDSIKYKNYEDIIIEDKQILDPTTLGTITHRFMELIVKYKNNIDNQLTNIKNLIINEFDLNDYKDKIDKLINRIYDQIINNKDSIYYILLKAEEVYTEVPFAFKENNQIVQGYIDLIYKLDGNYHIIDYKTNYDNTNLDKHYKNQLELYIKAAKIILKVDCDAKTYHINIKDYDKS